MHKATRLWHTVLNDEGSMSMAGKSRRGFGKSSTMGGLFRRATRFVPLGFAVWFALTAGAPSASGEQLCAIQIGPVLDNVDLESATNGDTTWISIPISNSGEGASAESGGGDNYTRTHAQLVSQPARFIIQLDQRVVAGESAGSSSSSGLMTVVLNVSGINAETTPVEFDR